MTCLAQAVISRRALEHNIMLLKRFAAPARLCAMVKADAYGHSAALVTRVLAGKVQAWGVATLDEAIALRCWGLHEPILVFCPLDDYFLPHERHAAFAAFQRGKLQPVIASARALKLLSEYACRWRAPLHVHLKVDTGMGRNGCRAEEMLALLYQASTMPGVKVVGLCSHFACADMADLEFARHQARVFLRLARMAAQAGLLPPLLHMANSAAIFNLPESRFDMVRPGIALYGYANRCMRGSQQLAPVLDLYAPVVLVKRLPRGHVCGYGATFITRRPTRVALVAAGYADGYDRRLSNSGRVDFDGKIAPVIGRVSMDTVMVDVTDLPEVNVGARARLISRRRDDPHSVESLAQALGTIPHEITCHIGQRVKRFLSA